MYSTKVTGSQNQSSSNQLNLNHSGHKATLSHAVKNKQQVKPQPKQV
jgi:hypothetical protein